MSSNLQKMSLDPIPDELKDLRKLEKMFIFKRIIFKKIAIMLGKVEFGKIKGNICNIPIESANISNILPERANSNWLIVVKSKQDLHYRGYAYFEPGLPNVLFWH